MIWFKDEKLNLKGGNMDKKNIKDGGWNFDNTYLDLPKVFYSKININPVSNPQ